MSEPPVINSSLPGSARAVAGSALQATLVDLLDLALVAKQAHWNLYGPRFRSLHGQLDEVAVTARDFADTVAERAAALGVAPDGRAATVAATSAVPAIAHGPLEDRAVVNALVDTFATVTRRLRERIAATDGADAVTGDLLIGLIAELEKQSWMFQAENQA
ncbi:Dps family protein [Kitasatospora sp. NPDC004531]